VTATCSTREASERTGATYRQLDYMVSRGFVNPPVRADFGPGEAFGRKWDDRRWRPVDVAAARAVTALISSDPGGRATDLARLASSAVYCWHDSASFVVVALNGNGGRIEPCFGADEIVTVADDLRLEGLPCCTVVPLTASQTSV
jgi:hypothetical protein